MNCTYIALCSTFTLPHRASKASHSPVYSHVNIPIGAARARDNTILGLNVLPKDTKTDWEEAGFNPTTLWLLDNLLYILKHIIIQHYLLIATIIIQ